MRESIARLLLGLGYASARLNAFVRRSVLAQMAAIGFASVLVVGLLLAALPARQASAYPTTKFDPRAPTALNPSVSSNLALDAAVQIPFNKAMDGASVAASLKLEPASPVELSWDESGQILTLRPKPFWSPYTYYIVDIASSARDRNGLSLGGGVHTSFLTGALTSATISATVMVGKEMSPTTAFQITFTRAVKLETVIARFGINPVVQGTMTGDDPTDTASQVFTFTPLAPLEPGTSYTVSFLDTLARDAGGLGILPVTALTAQTVSGPAVVRFRPRDKAAGVAPDQVVSVRFTTAMDAATTEAAFSVTVNGKAVEGKLVWSEHNTVLALDPKGNFAFGATVVATVADTAVGANGMKLRAAASATFKVLKPSTITIPRGGGVVIGTSPWSSMEYYALSLINCTRTGGWVISSGSCSSYGHHTLPTQRKLKMDSAIAARVARPFAKYLADRNLFSHTADGSVRSRFIRAGYRSPHYGENLGTKPATTGGQISEEIFYQNEYPCRCEHYLNIMYPNFDRVGIGIWVSHGRTRLVESFYKP